VAAAAGVGLWSGLRYYRAWRHGRAAREALAHGDLERARTELDAYLAVWPDSAEYHFLAARTDRRLSRYDEAEEHLRRCRELGGKREDIALEHRLIAVEQGASPADERALSAEADAGHPDAALIYEALAKGSFQSSVRVTRALEYLNKWHERDPRSVRALLWRGQVFERLLQKDSALADYEAAVALDAENLEARELLAWRLLHSERPDRALPHFELLHQRQPDNAHAVVGLALSLRGTGRSQEAAQLLDDLLARRPDDVDALRERGALALAARQPDRAEKWLRRALFLEPADEQANLRMSECIEQSLARSSRGFAAWLDPYVWLRRLEAAAYREVYLGLRADAGRFEKLYLSLLEGRGRGAESYYEMGNLLLRANRPEDAREWFEKAVRADSDHEPSRKALEALKKGRAGPWAAYRH
jgi:tetratricopeptide (TPR) repeat protein